MGRLKVWLVGLWGAVWCWGLAAAFVVTWVSPYALGEEVVHKFVFMMLLEFLVVHSTGFFSAVSIFGEGKVSRALTLFGLLAFYGLMAAGFSAAYGSPWPFYAFMLLALPQFPAIIMQGPEHGILSNASNSMLLGLNWSGMVLLYLGGAVSTVILDIPPLGITPEVVAAQGFDGGGAWMEEPHRVMAFGALYFTGKGFLVFFVEMLGARLGKAD